MESTVACFFPSSWYTYFPVSLVAPCGCVSGYLPMEYEYKWCKELLLYLLKRISLARDSLSFSYLASWNGDNQSPASQQLMAELLPAWVSNGWLEQSCPPSWNAYLVLLTGRQINFIVLWTTEFLGFSYSGFSLLYNTPTEIIFQDICCKVFYLNIENNQTI